MRAIMIARIFRGRVHYAWVVAAATFVVLLTAAGLVGAAMVSVMVFPLSANAIRRRGGAAETAP